MRKKKSPSWKKWLTLLVILLVSGCGFGVYQFWKSLNRVKYYGDRHAPVSESLKFEHVFRNNPVGILGIDISQYQGKIQWENLQLQLNGKPIRFIFIRASMGDNIDKDYQTNWKKVSELDIRKGAYHYYRPNQNSTRQAETFIRQVKLAPGDLPPVLDIEKQSTIQSSDRLRKGVQNWLDIIEAHYGVRPIIYTGDSFYQDLLLGYGFENYPLWVANYNPIIEPVSDYWVIWQFSEKGVLPGIAGKVDLNVMQGGEKTLNNLLIPSL